MKQLKDLVKPKRRVKTYTIEQLQETLDDLKLRGVSVHSIGILLVEGLVYSYFHDRPKYDKIVERMLRSSTLEARGEGPIGFSWE